MSIIHVRQTSVSAYRLRLDQLTYQITYQIRPYHRGLAWLLRSVDKLVHEETYPAVSLPRKI